MDEDEIDYLDDWGTAREWLDLHHTNGRLDGDGHYRRQPQLPPELVSSQEDDDECR